MLKNSQLLFMDRFILLLYAFCVTFSMTPSINAISLYLFVPLMGGVLIIKRNRAYYDSKYLYLYLILIIWMALTAVTADNPDVAWRHMIRILAAYIFSVVSFYLASKESFVKWLYLIIILYFVVVFYQASSGGQLVIAQSDKDRDQFEGVNANMLAYFFFYATFAIFMLLRLGKKEKFCPLIISSMLLLVFSVYLSLITASRQVLLIQVPLIVTLLLAIYFRFSAKNLVKLFSILALVIVVGFPIFDGYFSDSLLAKRSMENVSDDSRLYLIRKAIDEGTNYPLLGMGPNNFALKYKMFTHNSYLELLVSSGFPAMLIYIYMLIRFVYLQIRRYRRTGDRTFLMFFIYACTFFVDNIFYVFVGNMWLMGLFFIVVGHSEHYYKSYIYETKRC